MVFAENLDRFTGDVGEEGEVFDKIKEAIGFAGAANHGFEGDGGWFVFIGDPFPLGEVLPGGGDGAEAAVGAVGEDDETVVPEELGDGFLVVAEVVVEGISERFGDRFELDENQGETVDEPNQIGTAGVGFAADPELGGEEEVVAGRIVPVDDLDGFGGFRVPRSSRTSILTPSRRSFQTSWLAWTGCMAERSRAISSRAESIAVGGRPGLRRSSAARRREMRTTSWRVSRTRVPDGSVGFRVAVDRLVAELGEEVDGRLFDELFGVVGHEKSLRCNGRGCRHQT